MSRATILGRLELRPEENEQKLVTDGMHGVIRHPIYAAHTLVLLGVAVGSGLTTVYALLALALVSGSVMIRAEEKELEARFGQSYREYKARVPAFLPRTARR